MQTEDSTLFADPGAEACALRVQQVSVGSSTRLTIEGEIDLATVSQLVACLRSAVEAHTTVQLDLDAVEFMDSQGLSALLRQRAESKDTTFLIVGASQQVRRLLEITGTSSLFGLSGGPCRAVRDPERRQPTDDECVAAIRAMNLAPAGLEVERAIAAVSPEVIPDLLLRALWDLGWITAKVARRTSPDRSKSTVEFQWVTYEGRHVT